MEQGKTLRDLNRVTFEFEDTLLMALCFEVLNKNGMENKYLQETFKEPPNLHMNLDIKDGWLYEVQMLFRDILLINKELHKFYDVNRADGPFVVAGKLFKSNEADVKLRSSTIQPDSDETPLLKLVKSKDAQLEEAKRVIEEKDKEIQRHNNTINAIPPPPPNPDPWTSHTDDQGNVYYIHSETNESV